MKSTVYCARCRERLIVQITTNRHGTTYYYFVCSGRHEKRNGCDLPAIPMTNLEEAVEEEYFLRRLTPEELERVSTTVRQELAGDSEAQRKSLAVLEKESVRLEARRRKLLEAHLDGAVPMDLYKLEQGDISRRLAEIELRVEGQQADYKIIEHNFSMIMELASHLHLAYARATGQLRRQINQAVFKCVYVDDDTVEVELNEPFRTIAEVAGRPSVLEMVLTNETTPAVETVEGCRQTPLVPLEGLEPPTCSLGRSRSSIELQRRGGIQLTGAEGRPSVRNVPSRCGLTQHCCHTRDGVFPSRASGNGAEREPLARRVQERDHRRRRDDTLAVHAGHVVVLLEEHGAVGVDRLDVGDVVAARVGDRTGDRHVGDGATERLPVVHPLAAVAAVGGQVRPDPLERGSVVTLVAVDAPRHEVDALAEVVVERRQVPVDCVGTRCRSGRCSSCCRRSGEPTRRRRSRGRR